MKRAHEKLLARRNNPPTWRKNFLKYLICNLFFNFSHTHTYHLTPIHTQIQIHACKYMHRYTILHTHTYFHTFMNIYAHQQITYLANKSTKDLFLDVGYTQLVFQTFLQCAYKSMKEQNQFHEPKCEFDSNVAKNNDQVNLSFSFELFFKLLIMKPVQSIQIFS